MTSANIAKLMDVIRDARKCTQALHDGYVKNRPTSEMELAETKILESAGQLEDATINAAGEVTKCTMQILDWAHDAMVCQMTLVALAFLRTAKHAIESGH